MRTKYRIGKVGGILLSITIILMVILFSEFVYRSIDKIYQNAVWINITVLTASLCVVVSFIALIYFAINYDKKYPSKQKK
jgi:multisubunit Na+/H+ antiporter MnhB subunit